MPPAPPKPIAIRAPTPWLGEHFTYYGQPTTASNSATTPPPRVLLDGKEHILESINITSLNSSPSGIILNIAGHNLGIVSFAASGSNNDMDIIFERENSSAARYNVSAYRNNQQYSHFCRLPGSRWAVEIAEYCFGNFFYCPDLCYNESIK